MKATLAEKLSVLTSEPGCYLMKDKNNTIIYIGKAKRLKQRVSSYFTGAHDYKTTKMVSQVADFDIIITKTEKESLILEINLIKTHRPRYNILFMDDKSYPYLKLNKEGYPQVVVSRDRRQSPGFYYFGPYPNARAAHEMSKLLNESLPQQEKLLPNKQGVYNQLNKTAVHFTDAQLSAWRSALIKILKGNTKEFRDELNRQMMVASEGLNYESALQFKDKIAALDYISDKQQVQFNLSEAFDMFTYAYHQGTLAIVGLFVRSGRLLQRSMAVEACLEEPDDALVSFISQFYQRQPAPKLVYVPTSIDLQNVAAVVPAKIVHALRGRKRTLMEIGEKNALQQLNDQFTILKQNQQFKDQATTLLGQVLGIDDIIHRIEIFDNSHLSGDFAVSCCVVYEDGEPNKSQYRRYQLHQGNNDVSSMKEVLYRRFVRVLKEQKSIPDLIIVDGGINQLRAALAVIADLELSVPVCALVKDERHRTNALLTENEKLVDITQHSVLFSFLAQMQDEVHRFVVSYHRHLRKKAMTRSILDEVSGLGSVRQKKLYRTFGSFKKIKEASLEELTGVLPEKVAQELYETVRIDWNEHDEEN